MEQTRLDVDFGPSNRYLMEDEQLVLHDWVSVFQKPKLSQVREFHFNACCILWWKQLSCALSQSGNQNSDNGRVFIIKLVIAV
jgi:hypothetical protein